MMLMSLYMATSLRTFKRKEVFLWETDGQREKYCWMGMKGPLPKAAFIDYKGGNES